jgi:hypothetical protein
MTQDDSFDLSVFSQALAGQPAAERAGLVNAEVQRIRALTVRDAGKRFNQQMYTKALERLGRALNGQDVGGELTPSERPIHALLVGAAVPLAVAAVTAAPAPVALPQPPVPAIPEPPALVSAAAAVPELSGPERRTSRRIQMKTKVRIRRDADNVAEILEPLNISRGGVGFHSCKRFALHETVWVVMHYRPDSTDMETKSIIVRAASVANSTEFSYGLKFL